MSPVILLPCGTRSAHLYLSWGESVDTRSAICSPCECSMFTMQPALHKHELNHNKKTWEAGESPDDESHAISSQKTVIRGVEQKLSSACVNVRIASRSCKTRRMGRPQQNGKGDFGSGRKKAVRDPMQKRTKLHSLESAHFGESENGTDASNNMGWAAAIWDATRGLR